MSGADVTVVPLGGVELIDLRHQGLEGTVGAYVLPGEGGFALIEVGPLTTLPRLEAGIRAAGYALADLRAVLVTHIHLDHAGAAGALARRSGATVWAHPGGLPHLIDPERLVGSARRVYGERFDPLFGGMEALPEAQARALAGGERLELLGRRIEAIETPGHASSHLAFLVDGRDLFTGDAAAIRLPGSTVVRPATAPPEIDLEAWSESLARLRAARPERLLLTHFGVVDEVDAHLQAVEERTRAWADEVRAGLLAGEDDAALSRRIAALGDADLTAKGASPRLRERYRATSNDAMSVAGLARYWRKHHPERL